MPPPLVAVAVKLTLAPAHIVVLLACIETDGVTTGLTDIVTAFDVTCVCVTQVALLVSTQVTTAPLVNDVVENVALFVPWLLPFTFH